MRTLLPDPPPAEIEAALERRRQIGADRFDEVWEGVLHMVPGPGDRHALIEWQLPQLLRRVADQAGLLLSGQFNVGHDEDYRVPDGGLHRARSWGTYAPTAALVVEIRSPKDETWDKLPFYAAHHVDEVLIVDPAELNVHWLALEQGEYRAVERSGLIDLGPAELAQQIDWPEVDNG
ncbi:MAG: Uma2 family endonuclease [Actinomycetota bacterium]|nr:Uma2 family endonuclease [Actinomycetota bacterium]